MNFSYFEINVYLYYLHITTSGGVQVKEIIQALAGRKELIIMERIEQLNFPLKFNSYL